MLIMMSLYWASVIGNISSAMSFFASVLFIGIIGWLICFYIYAVIYNVNPLEKTKRNAHFWKTHKCLCIAFIASFLFAIFVPSKKEMVEIYSIGVMTDYIKNEISLDSLPQDCHEAISIFLENNLNDNTLKGY